MSLTIFLAICILGLDFLIYVLFHWTFGDKRKAISRQLAEHKAAYDVVSARPFLVTSQSTTARTATSRLDSRWSAGSAGTARLTLASQSHG